MESRARKHRLRDESTPEMFRNKKIKLERPSGEVMDVGGSYQLTTAEGVLNRDSNQNFR